MGNKHSMERCRKVQHIAVIYFYLHLYFTLLSGRSARRSCGTSCPTSGRRWRTTRLTRWSSTPTSTGTGWSTTTSGSPWWPPSRMCCGEMFNFSAQFDCYFFCSRVIFAERFSKFDEVSVNKSFCWMLENVFMKLQNPF